MILNGKLPLPDRFIRFCELANLSMPKYIQTFQEVLNGYSYWSLYSGKGIGDVGLIASVLVLSRNGELHFDDIRIASLDKGIKNFFKNHPELSKHKFINWQTFSKEHCTKIPELV